ncbi:translocation/assembly module TamB [Leminorella grimontii]|uniref:Translocation/assembly module TamB n=1 Tax=Leminorella grimontii TaxID=82981 RepID=A0AAV5N4I2_9GAMM|nr:translocation/assembly module TamB domain-containing protein [Leminorella grimontii]KFC94554.1 YtfN family protein [Leminorella grimontii ATCC 33999 = DSM 5078]GKX56649.1 translocation/assembly module TamB [Leminorella grimontii]
MNVKKWIKRTLIGLLLLVILLVAALAFLLGTQTGLQFTLGQLPKVVPGLSIGDVKGGLRDLTLSNVGYEMPGVAVGVNTFHLSINFGCITDGRICVNAVTADGANVKIDTASIPASETPEADTNSGGPITDIQTPYPIELSLLRLTNVNVAVDDMTIALGEFRTEASWQNRQINIRPTNVRRLTVNLPPAPQEAPAPPTQPVQTTGEALKALFSQPLLASLPEVILPMDFTLASLTGEDLRLTGGAPLQIDRLELSAETKEAHVQILSLKVNAPEGIIALTGDATMSERWPVNLTLNATVNEPTLRGEKLKLLLGGEVTGQLTVDLNASGPIGATLTAQTSLSTAGLPVALTLESPRVQWPLSGKGDYRVNNTRLRLTGSALDYALSLRASVEGTDIPPAELLLDGKGNEGAFTLSRLRLSALQGKAEVNGVVDWSNAVSWRAQLNVDGINTAKQWPEWPATLNGKVSTKGSLYGGSWQLDVPEIDLNGLVKQNRLSVQGALKGNDSGQWTIPGFTLSLGPNSVKAKGSLAKDWNLDADINAPKLTGMLPGLSGTAKGSLRLRGNAKAPQLLADLTANGLGWQDMQVGNVALNGDVTSASQIKGTLSLKVKELRQGDMHISQLVLDADGNESRHQLRLDISGEPVSGGLALSGSFDRASESWKGTLSNTRFNTPVGEWRPSQDVALGYRNLQQTVSVGSHCWRNPNAEVCIPKTIEAGPSGKASIVLNRFDLAMLAPMLGGETKAKGVFTGNADVSWSAGGGMPQATVALRGNGVTVNQMVSGRWMPIALDTLTLDAQARGNRAELSWLMKIANNGSLSGKVQVSDPQGSRGLSGLIKIDGVSLDLLKPVLGKKERAEGALNADLKIAGTAQSPRILGQLALERLRLNTQWAPLVVTEGRLAMNFSGTRSDLNGAIQTEKGSLTLGGNADWRNPDAWRAAITAKGDRIRIAMPPTVALDVSPDIVFEASPNLLTLNGSVSIPWARIVVEEVPASATGVSSDEVMLDRSLKPIEPKTASIPISSNLTINIGNNVSINAFGLKARLQGDLKVVQDKKGLGLNGQVNIPSGQFHAYGQDLIVRKGVIQFAGPPDQPSLNLEAIRNPDSTENDVTAGVRVTGLATEPKVEIFSDPAMSQQEALSYLLRGQGLDSSGGDSDMMTSMLIGMGVAKSGKLVGQIGEAFGVKNLSLDTQGVGDSSSVVVSGYIMPGLQVKYGVGIFDSLATLTLRYRLMPRLYLEAVSGIDQALDVLYQFEF